MQSQSNLESVKAPFTISIVGEISFSRLHPLTTRMTSARDDGLDLMPPFASNKRKLTT